MFGTVLGKRISSQKPHPCVTERCRRGKVRGKGIVVVGGNTWSEDIQGNSSQGKYSEDNTFISSCFLKIKCFPRTCKICSIILALTEDVASSHGHWHVSKRTQVSVYTCWSSLILTKVKVSYLL